MASLAISNSASTTLPTVNFPSHGHGHRKGLQVNSQSDSSTNSLGQLPVGATQNLFGTLLQSLQQVIGSQTTPTAATAATTATTGTSTTASTTPVTSAASPAVAQDLSGFLHSLFQVLKQDGLGASASTGTTAATSSTGTSSAPAVTGASTGQYQGSLVSSLQTLIQQVGSSASTSPAISNLDASFNNLVQGLNANSASAATSATGGTTSTQPSSAALQNFLNNLLQNLQANGLQAPKLTGSNVNANV